MVQIKLCGITRKEDVKSAVELGIDALGFILAKKSPRQVTLEKVKELITGIPPFISIVGVVVNPNQERLFEITDSGLFNYIQFHGSEDPEFINKIPLKTIKAISISGENDLLQINKYSGVDYYLFDTKVDSSQGGTGVKFDWNLLNHIAIDKPFILAGGLGFDNIDKAVEVVNPAGIDLNSKLEISPGIKNKNLLKKTIQKIKS